MTFDFTPDQQQFLAGVRDAVGRLVAPAAEEIDRSGEIPPALLQSIVSALDQARIGPGSTFGNAPLFAAVIVELAMGSAAVGAHLALGATAPSPVDLPGLRGSGAPSQVIETHRLGLAAVAIGIGRAAVAEAVSAIKQSGAKPGEDQRVPHWAVADAFTGIESAWLLVLSAAQALDRGDDAAAAVARARVMAGHAAEDAVLAALRIVGPAGYHRGAPLERLTRDARTLLFTLGTPESNRAIAGADLPG